MYFRETKGLYIFQENSRKWEDEIEQELNWTRNWNIGKLVWDKCIGRVSYVSEQYTDDHICICIK